MNSFAEQPEDAEDGGQGEEDGTDEGHDAGKEGGRSLVSRGLTEGATGNRGDLRGRLGTGHRAATRPATQSHHRRTQSKCAL